MPTLHEQSTGPVRVLRPPHGTNEAKAFFTEPIPGNSVVSCGTVELGQAEAPGGRVALSLAFASTAPGAIFPWQYHTGGSEVAFVVQGEGAIDVGPGDGRVLDSYPFEAGDLVLIEPGVIYQVRCTSSETPLRAWVGFSLGAESFWPDGRRA
jgi:mannose-6-phosphate isomerase-like protein (cupin superfamily)